MVLTFLRNMTPRLLWPRIALLALAYFTTGWLGLQLPYAGTHITLIWLPTGISVAALLLWGSAAWPGIFIGALAANLSIDSPWPLALGIALGNTLGPILTATLLRRTQFELNFKRHQDAPTLIMSAGLGMTVSALWGVANLYLAGFLPPAGLFTAMLFWWMGDTIGVLLATPLLLTLKWDNIQTARRDRLALLYWILIAAPVMWLAFFQDYVQMGRSLPLAFLTLPLLAWAALRFGMTGAALAALIFSVLAALGTALGLGTFFLPDTHISLFLLWAYMASAVLTGLLITALMAERHQAETEMKNLAFYDPLTQLPNRRLVMERLTQALLNCTRHQRKGALILIDLDNFKTLNDTLGHHKGDLLLQQTGRRLTLCVRESDTVARLGGDEFVVMLEGLQENAEEAAKEAGVVGKKILAALNLPYQLDRYQNHSTPSIGIALFSGHQESVEVVLKQADLAMYQAKAAGRNTLRYFDEKMQAIVTERVRLETDFREALEQQHFVVYYQPQVLCDGRLTGAEALVRWKHPTHGMVSPAEFIPLAEETGLILPLGYWVLETACVQLVKWAQEPDKKELVLSVNISAKQMHQPDFVDQVLAALQNSGANPRQLKLELTESLLVSNIENSIVKMNTLKAHGVGFSLDDFGTGFSSLSYLKRLPLDQLKIDISFVRDLLTDPNDVAIAKMIIALADSMGLNVIAEGVELEAQRASLERMGCYSYQGYLFSRPLPIDDFNALGAQHASSWRGGAAISTQ